MTKEIRLALKNILAKEVSLLPKHLDELKPKERIELLIKLLPYTLPKAEKETSKGSEDEGFDYEIEYDD